MSILTQAIKEAYADPDVDQDPLHTLELDHSTFAEPIRVVANALEDMRLPLGPPEGGFALFKAVGLSLTLQGFDDDGPTSGRLQLDNVSELLNEPLRQAVKAGQSLTILYRGYSMNDLTAVGEKKGGLLLSRVSLGGTSAVGTLEPATKADRQAFPRITYALAEYKALHGLN